METVKELLSHHKLRPTLDNSHHDVHITYVLKWVMKLYTAISMVYEKSLADGYDQELHRKVRLAEAELHRHLFQIMCYQYGRPDEEQED